MDTNIDEILDLVEDVGEGYRTRNDIVFAEETFEILGCCMRVYNELGKGFLEAVYKDALEIEFRNKGISYSRETKYEIIYQGVILPHKYFADFLVQDKIILEVKAQNGVIDEHFKQVLNYLAVSKCKLGLLVNFGEDKLKYKRLVL